MNPTISAYTTRILARDWGAEEIIAEGPGYCGKILRYMAGKVGGLQSHTWRVESFHLVAGRAWVDSDDGNGHLIRQQMEPGQTFHIPAGAAHRFAAITDCLVFEVSTSADADRVRMETQYGEPETGGLPSTDAYA